MKTELWSNFTEKLPKGDLKIYEIQKKEVRPELLKDLAAHFKIEGKPSENES